METPSILSQIGGESALEKLVDHFYARVLLDAALSPYFKNTDMKGLRKHQVQFLAQLLGGASFKGIPLRQAHAGRNITPEAFGKVAGHLSDSLIEFAVPEEIRLQILEVVGSLKDQVVHVQ